MDELKQLVILTDDNESRVNLSKGGVRSEQRHGVLEKIVDVVKINILTRVSVDEDLFS